MGSLPTDNDQLPSDDPHLEEDPVYLHARRESTIILGIWAIALVVTCTFCYLYGYSSHPSDPAAFGLAISAWVGPLESFNRSADSITTPLGLGIPDWVFYGIVIPWVFCVVFTFWFCLFVFKYDDLGKAQDSEADAGHSSEEGEPARG